MRFLIIVTYCLLSFSLSFAQPSNPRERIQEEKELFFNKEMNLTNAEKRAFWPVYNDYQNRKNRISAEKRTLMRFYVQNSNNLNDKEISDILNKYITYEKQEAELFENYTRRFREILSDEKVLKIYITEIKFKDYLLKQLRTD